MEETKRPGRRLSILARTARTGRIFKRLREGWAYDEIAREEHISAERVRQIVNQVLERRVVDRSEDRSKLQIERLRPALRLAGEAVARGELKAIGPLIRLVDRLDRHERKVSKPLADTENFRQRLLDKLNQAAENLADPETAGPSTSDGVEPARELGSDLTGFASPVRCAQPSGQARDDEADRDPAFVRPPDWLPERSARRGVAGDGSD